MQSASNRDGGVLAPLRRPFPRWIVPAALVLILLAMPLILPGYSLTVVQRVLIFALFAASLDLIHGFAGLPSLGHAAFFGLGGYTAAALMVNMGVTSFWVVVPAGVVMGALGAAIVGPLVLRSGGVSFLLITFAIGQLLSVVALEWTWLHSFGIEGLVGITWPDLGFAGWSPVLIYYVIAVLCGVGYLIAQIIVRTPLGLAAQGARENESRMRAFGFDVWQTRYRLFIISGALAALAGQLFVFQTGAALPTNLDITYSGLVFLIVVLAGAGTTYGPLVGSAVIITLDYFVGSLFPDRWPLVLGAVFVLTAIVAKRGLMGSLERRAADRSLGREGRPAPEPSEVTPA